MTEDGLFIAIETAVSETKSNLSVKKLREILAKQVSHDIFNVYQNTYQTFKDELKNISLDMKNLSKEHNELKNRLPKNKDRIVQREIVDRARVVGEKHALCKNEKKFTNELMKDYNFMKGINTIEALCATIQTSNYSGTNGQYQY